MFKRVSKEDFLVQLEKVMSTVKDVENEERVALQDQHLKFARKEPKLRIHMVFCFPTRPEGKISKVFFARSMFYK